MNIGFFFFCLLFAILNFTESENLGFWEILKRRIIRFPGTNWCGHENIADNFNDLGFFTQLDLCCRDHDLCPDTIDSGNTMGGLVNDSPTSRLACICDDALYTCFKNLDSVLAWLAGKMYFNTLAPKCFTREAYQLQWREPLLY